MNNEDSPKIAELIKLIQELQTQVTTMAQSHQTAQQDIQSLKSKRLYQMDFTPGCVKQAAMGEGNRFVRSGTAANKPTLGETVAANSSAIYFDTTNNKLWIYNATGTPAWKSVTLS